MRKTFTSGIGPRVVTLACGASVLIRASDFFWISVGGKPMDGYSFVLPSDQDSFEIVCEEGCRWSLDWFVPKPGHEVPDPTPVAIPAGGHRPESLSETIARMVRVSVSNVAQESGFDPEEEEDYDDDEDDLPLTPYEFEEHAARAEDAQTRKREVQDFIRKRKEMAARYKQKQQPSTPPAEPVVPAVGSTSDSKP